MAIDEAKLNAFMGNFVHDLGAVMHAATIVVGDQLGLYKALADGAVSAEGLARKTGTDARYVREWLSSQAASGYVQFDPATEQFSMTEEQHWRWHRMAAPRSYPVLSKSPLRSSRRFRRCSTLSRPERALPRGAGGRGAHPGCRDERRLQTFSPRH